MLFSSHIWYQKGWQLVPKLVGCFTYVLFSSIKMEWWSQNNLSWGARTINPSPLYPRICSFYTIFNLYIIHIIYIYVCVIVYIKCIYIYISPLYPHICCFYPHSSWDKRPCEIAGLGHIFVAPVSALGLQLSILGIGGCSKGDAGQGLGPWLATVDILWMVAKILHQLVYYPPVNIQTTMENHHIYWVNQLIWPCSMAMWHYQRVGLSHYNQSHSLQCLMVT